MPNGGGFIERMGLRAVLELKEFRTGIAQYIRLTRQAQQATQETAKATESATQDMGAAWDSYWKKVHKTTLDVQDDVEDSAAAIDKSFDKVIKKLVAAVIAFKAVQKATQFLKEATLLAARVEVLGVALEVVGANAGYSTAQVAGFEEAVKATGITTRKARQSLLFAGQAQIDFADTAALARIAQDAAVIAYTDSSDAFQRLTWTISTGSVLMARRLGLQVSFERAYERMALQIGKSTEELSENERVQARVNAVILAGTQIAGTYEASMEASGKIMLTLNRLFEEAQLVIGRVNLGGFAIGIDEITRLIKDLLQWMEDNNEELEAMGVAVEQLVGALADVADLELPVEQLTEFVDKLTTLTSIMAVGIEVTTGWKEEIDALGISMDTTWGIMALFPGMQMARGMGALLDKFTEMRKEVPAAFKTFDQVAREISRFKEPWEEIAAREKELARERAAEAARAALGASDEEEDRQEKIAEKLQDGIDKIQDLQRKHYQRLADMAADANRRNLRAFNKYSTSLQKQGRKHLRTLEKITRAYEKRRAKAIKDAEKRIARAEADAAKTHQRAQDDWELRERQARERFDLDMLQSVRRYQFERNRLVAEGDTLAIEQLDARFKLEEEERKEDEALRQKHSRERRRDERTEEEEDVREQVAELREDLAETLAEIAEAYRERLEEQRIANAERLNEITSAYLEQQRLRDEDDVLARQKAEANYRRQLEDLGGSLRDQEELQEFGAENVERVLEKYYGEDGVSDLIMQGWHEREDERIAITAAMLSAMGQAGGWGPLLPGGIPMPGQAVGMQMGGILEGPAMAYIEPGIREAFVPLTGPGAVGGGGGAFTHEFLNALQVAGLEGASPSDAGLLVKALVESLTAKLRTKRRQ